MQFVDHRRGGGVVHRDRQHRAEARDRHNQAAPGVVGPDELGQAPVERHLFEVDEGDVELTAERSTERLVGDELHLEEHLTERLLHPGLLGQRLLQLGLREGPSGDQNLAESDASGRAAKRRGGH